MNVWKFTTTLLAIILGISLMWNVQQEANFEKHQLKAYAREHSQLEQLVKVTIENYESTEDQQELSLRLMQSSGFVQNIGPAGSSFAYITSDFDYDIGRVFYDINEKTKEGKIEPADIEKLKLVHEFLIMFGKITLHKVDSKSLDTFEFDLKRFMNHYNSRKGPLFE